MPFDVIRITKGEIHRSGVDFLNLGIVLESVGFIEEECCLAHSQSEGVVVNNIDSLKGGLLEGLCL